MSKIPAQASLRKALPISPGERAVRRVRVIVERHVDGYVAYPLGMEGVVIGAGDTADEALADVESAIQFHVETFGPEVLDDEAQVLDVSIVVASLDA